MTDHRFIYLAHPIDFDPQTRPSLTPYTKAALEAVGLGWYDPQLSWGAGKLKPGPEIERVNHHALSVCTGVIVIAWGAVPSIGTWREVEKARLGWAKPIAVVTDQAGSSWSLADGHLQIFDLEASGGRTLAVNAAVKWLKDQETGVTPFDRDSPRKRPLTYQGPPNAFRRGYADDAGLDIRASEDAVVRPGEFADIPSEVTGIQLPEGCWGLLTGRSSTLREKGLLVHTSIIDPGWRGPLFCGAFNVSKSVTTVRAGERIAQLILMWNHTPDYEPTPVEELEPHSRGFRGFGSTGH